MSGEREEEFDVLRALVTPVAPDPAFAAALRSRLVDLLLTPQPSERTEGVSTMTTQADPASTTTPATTEPASVPLAGDVVYASLRVSDVDAATEFYGPLLGWSVSAGSIPEGRSIHDLVPPLGLWGGAEANTLFLCHAVEDVHAAVARVRELGGQADEPEAQPYGLTAGCVDNQGMSFALNQAPAAGREPLGDPRQGELAYLTFEVQDSAAFRAFYGGLFGWRFSGGRVNDGWQIQGVQPLGGVHGGAARSSVIPMYTVTDIGAAVATVRRLGGTAADPATRPYGLESYCADNQGGPFYLGQF